MSKRIVKNSIWLLTERVYGIINGAVAGVIVIRYLGPELNGELAYINSLFAVLSFMATLGLSSITTKEIIDNPYRKVNYLSSALTLQLLGACFMGFFIISYIYFFSAYNIFLVFVIWISWLINRTQIYAQYFESKTRAQVYVSIKLVSMTASIITKMLVVYYNLGIQGIGYSYLAESIVYAVLIIYFFKKEIVGEKIYFFEYGTTLYMLKKCTPLLMAAIATPLFMQMDIIMLENMTNTYNVGLYNAATKISMPLYFLMGVVVTSYYPMLIKLIREDKKEFEKKIRQLVKIAYALSFLVVIPLFLFSREIISILYGDEYIGAVDVLRIHSFSIIFAYLAPIGSRWLLITNNLRHEFLKTTAGALINIILNYILIGKYGIEGAAISSVVAYFTSNLGYFIFSDKTRIFFWCSLCLK